MIEQIDELIYNQLFSMQTITLTNVMLIITSLISIFFLSILTLCFFSLLKNKRTAAYITLNLFISTILSHILKFIFARPRPNNIRLVQESGFSFPSAHAMIGISYYGFLIYLIVKHAKKKSIKYLVAIGISILIILVGLSRVYLGVHYFSDIIGGFIFGAIYLLIYIYIYERRIAKQDGMDKRTETRDK